MSGQYPAARWRGPVPNMDPAGMVMPPIGVVLHIQQGTEEGTDSWFHNPASQVSAHFGAPLAGGIDQWVMIGDKAWHASAANPHYVGIECEGTSGETLTTNQAESIAQLLAWLNRSYGIPLILCDIPGQPGLAWHGLGGEAWGGHFDCPGQPIVQARPALIQRAAQLVGSVPPPPPAGAGDPRVEHLQQLLNAAGAAPALAVDGQRGPLTNGAFVRYMTGRQVAEGSTDAQAVSIVQAMLVCWGYGLAVDGSDGQLTTAAVKNFQTTHPACGGVDGVVGPLTSAALADGAAPTPAPTPAPSSGDPRVEVLQKGLNAAGAAPALVVDGQRGPLTNAAFVRYMAGRDVVEGNNGQAVAIVQAMLACWGYDVAVDGSDGPITTWAVKAFQTTHPACGLVDGVVGPLTVAALAS